MIDVQTCIRVDMYTSTLYRLYNFNTQFLPQLFQGYPELME